VSGSRPAGRGGALVTGASSGIGRELARRIAADGWRVALVARRAERLEALADDLRARHGAEVRVVPADLAAPGGPALVERELEALGLEVDFLVNNAGFGTWGPFVEQSLESQLEMLRVNVMALTELTGRFLPRMRSRGHGVVLNVASLAGFQPGPGMAVYYASKAYVLHFSEALREELRDSGVSVTALCPGPTASEFQARAAMTGSRLGRNPFMMEAGRVAEAGYRGAMRGRTVVVPGALNRVASRLPRLFPRAITRRAAALVNAER
jgi:uncharacterized protein